jgi:diguanylate cyclase (GGDEF)-like protein
MQGHVSETWSETAALRGALARAYEVLRERDLERQLALVTSHLEELLDASAVRIMRRREEGWTAPEERDELPASARAMEAALLPRALAAGRSLLSSHPALDEDIAGLSAACRADGCIIHVLLVRAHQATQAVFAVHWVGRDRPEFDRRLAFYYYWDLIGLAVAAAGEQRRIDGELAELRRSAYTDLLTGLPNALAFERQLREHGETEPLSIVVLDFDGMREANAALGWVAGGDALIRAVGEGLAQMAQPGEVPARLHTAGDEFALLLPGVGQLDASLRAAAIEVGLDALSLSEELQAVYKGASVGHATRRAGETSGQALGRAVAAMRDRKEQRAAHRTAGH